MPSSTRLHGPFGTAKRGRCLTMPSEDYKDKRYFEVSTISNAVSAKPEAIERLIKRDKTIRPDAKGHISQRDGERLIEKYWDKLPDSARKLAKEGLHNSWDTAGRVPRKQRMVSEKAIVGAVIREKLKDAGIKAGTVRMDKRGVEIRVSNASDATVRKIEKLTADYQIGRGSSNYKAGVPQVGSITVKNEKDSRPAPEPGGG